MALFVISLAKQQIFLLMLKYANLHTCFISLFESLYIWVSYEWIAGG